MPIEDPLVMPILIEVLDCLNQEVAKVTNPPTFVQARAGGSVAHLLSLVEDECCQGLAWVRPGPHWPSSNFPEQDEAPLPKGVAAWAVTLELGVIRCMPTPGADRIPTADEWMAVTQAVMDDAAAMRRAICCWIESGTAAQGRERNTIIGQWLPIEIEGGCVGGTITVVIKGPACDCSQAGSES